MQTDRPPYCAIIKIVGVGNGAINVVDQLIEGNLDGIESIAISGDTNHLMSSTADWKFDVSGHRCPADWVKLAPAEIEQAAEACRDQIAAALDDAELVIMVVGEGGHTGTTVAPVVARIARSLGALTIGLATRPFSFEGRRRAERATAGIDRLRAETDMLIVVRNDHLLPPESQAVSVLESFRLSDQVLVRVVKSLIGPLGPSLYSFDLADLKDAARGASWAYVGLGSASGKDRGRVATEQAIASPLLEAPASQARTLLLVMTSTAETPIDDLTAASRPLDSPDYCDTNVVIHPVIDVTLGDEMQVTAIVTGPNPNTVAFVASARQAR